MDARIGPDGQILNRPCRKQTTELFRSLKCAGLESIAIVVIHAYQNTQLEQELGIWAHDAGFSHVSLSSQIACELGMLGRGDTTVCRCLPYSAPTKLLDNT